MNQVITQPHTWNKLSWYTGLYDYSVDTVQRSLLYADVMRKRGNMYLTHARLGHPPVLIFDYEMVMDGRILENPVNYSLIRILERRGHQPADEIDATAGDDERRGSSNMEKQYEADVYKRPIVVIDPRAGHGPGIGGSKLDSQIGVALAGGHPVYFIMFYPEPEPNQTLAHVQKAEVQFLEEVIRRHPKAEKPAIIGNCQAGWATALIGADRPDVTGPMVFNGSPMSYWGGIDGANPMRYKGGLCGGVWLTSLWSDLGNGQFDGANLVAGFEDLSPANTIWSKQYHLYANIDTEEQRYLNFEKWWGGFFKMNREEIHFIVDSLFVGNELEHGQLQLAEDRWINLKNFKDPIVVFASEGDNITPPQQALNWIYKAYRTVDEIKRNGQVIVYILHPKIGHLGIFVGSKIARKEHSAIIGSVDMIEYLAPGLYEMVITDEIDEENGEKTRNVVFEERDMKDILLLDDGLEDEEAFSPVAAISRFNDKLYQTFLSPWVRGMTTERSAETLRQLHPLRTQRYMLSDANPFLYPLKYFAPWIKHYRRPVQQTNPFLKFEKILSEQIAGSLNEYQDYRDQYLEHFFKLMYDNSWIKALFPEMFNNRGERTIPIHSEQSQIEKELWAEVRVRGGFTVAIVRIMLLIFMENSKIDQRQFALIQETIASHPRVNKYKPAVIKQHVKEQAAIVNNDAEAAIATLPKLLKKTSEREEAYHIAQQLTAADTLEEQSNMTILKKLKTSLKL